MRSPAFAAPRALRAAAWSRFKCLRVTAGFVLKTGAAEVGSAIFDLAPLQDCLQNDQIRPSTRARTAMHAPAPPPSSHTHAALGLVRMRIACDIFWPRVSAQSAKTSHHGSLSSPSRCGARSVRGNSYSSKSSRLLQGAR